MKMITRFFSSKPAVRFAFYQPDGTPRVGRWRPGRTLHLRTLSALLLNYLPGAGHSELASPANTDVAVWCFVFPATVLGRKGYYYGAFRVVNQHITGVLYVQAPLSWLGVYLKSTPSLAFWMARILILFGQDIYTNAGMKQLKSWVQSLQRSCSPFFESVAIKTRWRFAERAALLIEESGAADYLYTEASGLDVLPWLNWPACIEYQHCIWFWKLSRFGKVVDSRKVFMTSELITEAK